MNSHQDMFVSFILGDYHHPSQKQSVGDVDVDCRVDRVEFERFLGARGNIFFNSASAVPVPDDRGNVVGGIIFTLPETRPCKYLLATTYISIRTISYSRSYPHSQIPFRLFSFFPHTPVQRQVLRTI